MCFNNIKQILKCNTKLSMN